MVIFGSNNCVYTFPRQATGGGYQLAGLQSSPPLVIQGAAFQDTDIVLPINTLTKERFLYCFGKNFDGGYLQGVALLGAGGASGLSRYVDGIRTSGSGRATTLSTPLGGFRVFVTGFGMAVPDAEYNMQPFSIMFKIAS